MDKLELVINALQDKQAVDITSINMESGSPFVDYFVICHASNQRLVNALKDVVVEELVKNDFEVKKVEGLKDSAWILVDGGDIIVHIFEESERKKFNLEKLWGDLPQKQY